MNPTIDMAAIRALPIGERVELAQAILDTVTEDFGRPPLTDELKAHIEQRLALHRANPDAGTPWEAVIAETEARAKARAAARAGGNV